MLLPLDEQLMEQFRKGDESVFKMIDAAYRKRLYYVAFTLLGNKEAAEDKVQDTFSKLWVLRANFEKEANIKAFLFIALKNGCKDELKRNKRKTRSQKELLYLLEHEESQEKVIERMEIASDLLQMVNDMMDRLPEKEREVFRKHFLQNLPIEKIAEQQGVEKKTVQNQRSQAITKIRQMLKGIDLLMIGIILQFVC